MAQDPTDSECALSLLLLEMMMKVMMIQETMTKVRVSNLHGSQDQDHTKLSPKGFEYILLLQEQDEGRISWCEGSV